LLPAFGDVYAAIVFLMTQDESQAFFNAELKTSTSGKKYFKKSITGHDNILRVTWRADGNMIIDFVRGSSILEMNGYKNLSLLESGGIATDKIDYRIKDTTAIEPLEDFYEQLLDLVIADTELGFDGAVKTDIPEPTPIEEDGL
jgi:hypothetical protein